MLTDEQIFDILDGYANAEVLQAHKNLMLNSLAYQQYFKELETLHLDLAAMPLEQTPVSFTDNVLAAIPAEKPVLVLIQKKVWSSRLAYIFFGVLLTVMLVVTIIAIYYQPSDVTSVARPNPVFEYLNGFLTQDFSKIAVLLNLIVVLVIFDRRVLQPYFKQRRITLG